MKGSEVVLYQIQDSEIEIPVQFKNETAWLSQAQMATLFQKSVRTINEHIKNIYREGELDENSVIRKFRITARDGKTYRTKHYSLDVIISVGYRVKSRQGTQFRIWATRRLRDYILKGFAIDDERMAQGGSDYFDELVERVRAIRTSEKNFYEKVKGVFATSVDYDSTSITARQFYAIVQNKFHYAIHGHTAAELIVARVDGGKSRMGLTHSRSDAITLRDATIAKNYLQETELKGLRLLAEQLLAFAELRHLDRKPIKMANWMEKLDGFLRLNDKGILQDKGTVSQSVMKTKVRTEITRYRRHLQAG
jgi:hypothetical protein